MAFLKHFSVFLFFMLFFLYVCDPIIVRTSLLGRLQAQTLPDATPPIGQVYPSSKMAGTFEPMIGF